jgi:hypothetical protein
MNFRKMVVWTSRLLGEFGRRYQLVGINANDLLLHRTVRLHTRAIQK